MKYAVRVTKCGVFEAVFEIVAENALAAINSIEVKYKPKLVRLDDKSVVSWSGFEFEARRV